jgi:hypothetical protein
MENIAENLSESAKEVYTELRSAMLKQKELGHTFLQGVYGMEVTNEGKYKISGPTCAIGAYLSDKDCGNRTYANKMLDASMYLGIDQVKVSDIIFGFDAPQYIRETDTYSYIGKLLADEFIR